MCKIDFTFTTTTAASYIITFDVPVVGFAEYVAAGPGGTPPASYPELEKQIPWYIRGGTISDPLATPPAQPRIGSGEVGVALAIRSEPHEMADGGIVGPIKPEDIDKP